MGRLGQIEQTRAQRGVRLKINEGNDAIVLLLERRYPSEFRRLCHAAGVGPGWTPRGLRHTGISLLSRGGLPVEEIARIAGHASTRTTEVVYRRELRPVITSGAQTVDRLLGQTTPSLPGSRPQSDVA